MTDSNLNYDVFLSHSSKDKATVRPLAERLRNSGLKVWFDEWAISPGDSIPRKVDQGLEESAVLVLCMSVHSLGSDWVAVEHQAYRFTDPVNRDLRFIPLRLDETEPRASLRQFAYVDWRGGGSDDAYARLLRACQRRHGQAAHEKTEETPTEIIKTRAFRVLRGHAGKVLAVAISADGKRIISGSADNNVRVWAEGYRVLTGHIARVNGVAISADGKRAVSGSADFNVRVWDLQGDSPPRILRGHMARVNGVAISADGTRAISGSDDNTVRVWNLDSGTPSRALKGHTDTVCGVAISADGKWAISGSADNTVCIWDLDGNAPPRVLEGHTAKVWGVTISANGKTAISGSADNTARLWDVDGNAPPLVLEGHTGEVKAVAISANGRRAITGSVDQTVRVWDLDGNASPLVLEGHEGAVLCVAISSDGKMAVSGADDKNVGLWNLEDYAPPGRPEERIRYTNAKVVLVGDSGSGKTGISVRLAQDLPPSRWPSTSGVWSTQWPLKDLPDEAGWDRELWLWDFGGQADQRLIHQLYLDRTAAVLLIFDGDKDTVLPGLREWQQALAHCISPSIPVLLLAGRTDVGSRFDRTRVQEFARDCGYPFFETSAETNRGIPELRKSLLTTIPWSSLDQHDSPARFKRLRDEVLLIRDEGGVALATFKELESLLTARLPVDFNFSSAELKTVVSLLDGPGVVKELNFGSYILLRPEWINIYAQAVIRTLRAAELGLGYMPVRAIREGKLIFQPSQVEGQPEEEEKRLGPADEQIVLQSMESVLLARRLCLQQDGDLVFPSYCGRERPVGPVPLQYFVSYTIDGFLDDIYATLVVKLAHCGALKLKDLWRDAADFGTLADRKLLGIRLQRRDEGGGEILAHHAMGVTGEEQVIFASYIHQHLIEQSTAKVRRLRHYNCPNCNEPVRNRELAMERLREHGGNAEILCPRCEGRVALWDRMEELFSEEAIRLRVRVLRTDESIDLDARRLNKLLAHEVSARVLSADQRCVEIPQEFNDEFDLEVEFTDVQGRGAQRHMYLQLKAGNSHLVKRKVPHPVKRKDKGRKEYGAEISEIFKIPNKAWLDYCLDVSANGPVMLVIGTFPESEDPVAGSDKRTFADIRWMEIGQLLREESAEGTKSVRHIVFKGERLDAESVLRWKNKILADEAAVNPSNLNNIP